MIYRDLVPWWGKILIKIILSRLPVPYRIWQKFNIFRHGAMDDPKYACDTFLRHYNNSGIKNRGNGFVMLELGPGDSLASGIIAGYFGAAKSYLVDKSSDAEVSSYDYEDLFQYLATLQPGSVMNDNCRGDINDLKKNWNIEYMTGGLASLREITESSIDFLWSQSVIEHIRLGEFRDYVREFRRVIKDDGICIHGIDLKDHLSFGLNNLRFSENFWESAIMAESGFYTNRLRFTELLEVFSQEGFMAKVLSVEKWDKLPTNQEYLYKKFRAMSSDELIISAFDVLLYPAG